MINYYHICYCAYCPNGEHLDKDHQFKVANIVANSESEAIQQLRDEFPMLDIKIMGRPYHKVATDHEFETGVYCSKPLCTTP